MVVDPQLTVARPYRKQMAWRADGESGPPGDSVEDGLHIIARHEIGDAVPERLEAPGDGRVGPIHGNLHRDRACWPPGEPEQALDVALCLALHLDDLCLGEVEERRDVGEKPRGVLAQRGVPRESCAADGPHEPEAVAGIDGLHVDHGAELGRDLRHPAQDLSRRSEGAQQRGHAGRTLSHQRLAARITERLRVAEHRGGRLQQGAELAEGAPGPNVLQFGRGPAFARQRQQLLHRGVAAAAPHQPDQQPRRCTRAVPLVTHPAQLDMTQTAAPVAKPGLPDLSRSRPRGYGYQRARR